MFVDFNELKEKTSFGEVVRLLGLTLKHSGNQWRGPCPTCKSGGDRALVVTEGKGFFCFADKKGGDQIALAAHILACSVKDAATHLAQATGTVPSIVQSTVSTVPESVKGQETQKLQPLAYLESEHLAVDAIGFSPEIVKQVGIGYAAKGIMRGTVAVPIRDEHGSLLGYIGITEARLPQNFTTNILRFPKTA